MHVHAQAGRLTKLRKGAHEAAEARQPAVRCASNHSWAAGRAASVRKKHQR